MFLQLLTDGFAMGSLYALIALAMVIIYKTSDVPNFAQGEMGMISAFFAYYLMEQHGFAFPYSFIGALVFAMLLGIVFEFFFIRRAKEPNILNFILITLGFERMLFGLAGWKWGPDQKAFPATFDPIPVTTQDMFTREPIAVSYISLFIILFAIVLIVSIFLFFKYTKLGIAMKATQQNPSAARINGIRTNRIMSITWGLSSVVGAIAAMLLVPGTCTSLDNSLMMAPLLKGFAAAVLGGMSSLIGSIGGGIILGIIEKLFGYYISSEFESVVAFMIIILILWFRPSGLWGKHYVKKV
ncbi:MAG: branched-chain amino acid ABC transporter permease [bacterium]|nr:branched-chain amino acid ABC transporter permease [bacterium]